MATSNYAVVNSTGITTVSVPSGSTVLTIRNNVSPNLLCRLHTNSDGSDYGLALVEGSDLVVGVSGVSAVYIAATAGAGQLDYWVG